MDLKSCLVVLLVALAMVAAVESSKIHDAAWGLKQRHNNVGDMIGEETEMLLDSEDGRRQLMQGRFISYEALKKDNIPCGQRGKSYYDCNNRNQVNSYRRGCTYITRCARSD
ncbi:putative rapid ALkalinization Factor [Rosa chinensis]|uniref:Putative rapid ALkalinization Factor n=1 Tax=Rosa chinensis TaxID=74649 RepID=A0A2P6Q451_ROSCH|nr:protein RALF-like 4 [Rosa chinensis]PRQ28961.1 putative rapid ALkalinization Factor [Rosa chinensis]